MISHAGDPDSPAEGGAGASTAVEAVIDVARIREAFRQRIGVEGEWTCGRLVLDGARPFLLVLRSRDPDDPLRRLLRGEASYLVAEEGAEDDEVSSAVRVVAAAGAEAHGTFLVIEIWGGSDRFRVLGPDGPAPATVRALERGLGELERRLRSLRPERSPVAVEVEATDARHPPGRAPLLTVTESHEGGTLFLGVEIPSLHRDPETDARYPLFLRRMFHGLSDVLRGAVFEFLKVQTGADLPSFRALGRRSLGAAVWEADRELAEIDASFDVLLLVAPTNEVAAWERFRDGGQERGPELHYRLLPIDPDMLKRRLYDIRLEDVEDPAAWRLLRDKREELDKRISLLSDRNTPGFLQGSIRLYGHMTDSLRERAEDILAEVPPPGDAGRGRGRRPVGAREFAALAREEFARYRARYDAFESEVQIRPDLVGLMVSSGKLLIGQSLALAPERVDALLQHEVGTHVLTFVNGAAQPFVQLSRGLADYDELQEGLGVLAEYLVGGLTAARLRLLAARVLAVDSRLQGAEFVETFRQLNRDHAFSPRTAFDVSVRVHQCGGFTRDMIYLRGLVRLVEYLRDGGELEPLYVGKIAARHLEAMRELRERGVLRPTPLLPRFLDRPEARERLRVLRAGLPVHAMAAPVPETD